MSASLLAMPMLIINMGGEMLYILEQRLKAQNISSTKSTKVLQDVVSTMYSSNFITELFKPQRIYTQSSTRQIFDRLAHSSIMRLNSSSMGKLYDLMTMGFKYQVMSCKHPAELLQISLNHLDSLRSMLPPSSPCLVHVDRATKLFMGTYGGFTVGQFSLLRHTLCRFFQDRRVKVSLFLKDGIQTRDGLVVVSHSGPLPMGSETPGFIRYYSGGNISSQDSLSLGNASGVSAVVPVGDVTSSNRPCKLGLNMYAPRSGGDNKSSALRGSSTNRVLEPENFQPSKSDQKAAKAELNLLAGLIGTGSSTGRLNINLFPTAAPDVGSDGKNSGSEIIVFDAADRTSVESMYKRFGNLDLDEPEQKEAEQPMSLLGLMDMI